MAQFRQTACSPHSWTLLPLDGFQECLRLGTVSTNCVQSTLVDLITVRRFCLILLDWSFPPLLDSFLLFYCVPSRRVLSAPGVLLSARFPDVGKRFRVLHAIIEQTLRKPKGYALPQDSPRLPATPSFQILRRAVGYGALEYIAKRSDLAIRRSLVNIIARHLVLVYVSTYLSKPGHVWFSPSSMLRPFSRRYRARSMQPPSH